jgi:predicted secreted protein
LKNLAKILILTCLILAVAFSGCLGGGGDDSTNETGNTSYFYKNITLAENDTILKFEFITNPSTGYGWVMTANNTGVLNEVVNNVTTSTSGMVGASGIHTFSYKAQSPGMTSLNFKYERSFENDTTLEDLTCVIQVNSDNTIEILSVTTPDGNLLPFPKSVTLEENGTAIQMTFKENPTTGYTWNVSVAPANVLNMTADNFISPNTDMPGASGLRAWQFESLKAGKVSLIFDHNRSFEDESTTEIVVVELETNANGIIKIRGICLATV